MLHVALPLAATLLAPLQSPVPADRSAEEERFREFDFWLGEWSVNNRFPLPDASWVDGGTSRARITPVLGGRAVFEEWSGELARRGRVIGMSLRAYDPAAGKWHLLLNWPGQHSNFGTLTGTFRHGRGEFFAGGGDSLMRYTFSDALEDSVRWDSARSADGGRTWRTDWIMEFRRTAPAAEDDAALFEVPWEPERTAPEACRELDFLTGRWKGALESAGEDGAPRTEAVELRAATVLRGWVTVCSLRREDGSEDLRVYGYMTRDETWECWSLSREDTRLVRSLGDVRLARGRFESLDEDRRHTVELADDGELVLTLERKHGAEWRTAGRGRLARTDG